jgi:hypothetical protein
VWVSTGETRRRIAWAGAVLGAVLGVSCLTGARADAAPPSAIGQESVSWVAVSPAYAHSGLVVAAASPMTTCGADCNHLWVSHDGGGSWTRVAATGWGGGRPAVAADSTGREVIYAATGTALQRSDDAGVSWHDVGPAAYGSTPSPQYSRDATLAAAGPQDYLVAAGAQRQVPGSGGAATDLAFAFAPDFPSSGSFPAALLASRDGSGLPVIERCDANLRCSGAATLAGATTFSSPVTLLPAGDYATTGSVFAQSGRGIYKSLDGGTSFAPLAVVNAQGAKAVATPMLALAPGYRDAGPVRTVYAAVLEAFQGQGTSNTAGGVFRSDDAGATWHAAGSGPLSGGATAVAVAPDGRLFAGYLNGAAGVQGTAGLLCSADGGATWQATCTPVGARQQAAASPAAPAPALHASSTSTCAAACPAAVVPQTAAAAAAVPSVVQGASAPSSSIPDGAGGSTNREPAAIPAQAMGAGTTASGGSSWRVPALIAAVLLLAASTAPRLWRRFGRGRG